jgi:hypothetical protein
MSIRKRRSDRSGRAPLPSPGRPPVADRDERRRFWAAIAAGMASEDAAVEAGASSSLRAEPLFPAPPCPGKAVGMGRGRIGDGPGHGARSRSPNDC